MLFVFIHIYLPISVYLCLSEGVIQIYVCLLVSPSAYPLKIPMVSHRGVLKRPLFNLKDEDDQCPQSVRQAGREER